VCVFFLFSECQNITIGRLQKTKKGASLYNNVSDGLCFRSTVSSL